MFEISDLNFKLRSSKLSDFSNRVQKPRLQSKLQSLLHKQTKLRVQSFSRSPKARTLPTEKLGFSIYTGTAQTKGLALLLWWTSLNIAYWPSAAIKEWQEIHYMYKEINANMLLGNVGNR